jgi:hypothetical protein
MYAGRLSAALPADGLDRGTLGLMMAGHHEERAA